MSSFPKTKVYYSGNDVHEFHNIFSRRCGYKNVLRAFGKLLERLNIKNEKEKYLEILKILNIHSQLYNEVSLHLNGLTSILDSDIETIQDEKKLKKYNNQ